MEKSYILALVDSVYIQKIYHLDEKSFKGGTIYKPEGSYTEGFARVGSTYSFHASGMSHSSKDIHNYRNRFYLKNAKELLEHLTNCDFKNPSDIINILEVLEKMEERGEFLDVNI